MKSFSSGLVVGKFAPLHSGHEQLIHAALAQCGKVFVISYSVPEMPGCEPEKRELWFQQRFPQCTVLVLSMDIIEHFRLEPPPHNDADPEVVNKNWPQF